MNLPEAFVGDLSPSSDEFGKVGLGEELELRYVLAPFKICIGKILDLGWGGLISGGALLNGGRD